MEQIDHPIHRLTSQSREYWTHMNTSLWLRPQACQHPWLQPAAVRAQTQIVIRCASLHTFGDWASSSSSTVHSCPSEGSGIIIVTSASDCDGVCFQNVLLARSLLSFPSMFDSLQACKPEQDMSEAVKFKIPDFGSCPGFRTKLSLALCQPNCYIMRVDGNNSSPGQAGCHSQPM